LQNGSLGSLAGTRSAQKYDSHKTQHVL